MIIWIRGYEKGIGDLEDFLVQNIFYKILDKIIG